MEILARILPIEFLQLLVQFRMFVAQFFGFFEEAFGGHGEKLGWIFRTVVIQQRFALGFRVIAELLELATQHACPLGVARSLRQNRRAVRVPVFLIQLMRELMKHEVLPIVDAHCSRAHRIPRQHYCTRVPRFSEAVAVLCSDDVPRIIQFLRHISARVHEDGAQPCVAIRLAVQQEQASLGGDDHFHLGREFEAAATLKILLGEKHLDMSLQLFLVGVGQSGKQGEPSFKAVAPFRREWLNSQALSSSAL